MITTRTAQQIIAQTNELARRFAKLEGYDVAAGHKFYSPDGNGRDRKWWAMACEAQRLLTKTDPEDALRDEPEPEAAQERTPAQNHFAWAVSRIEEEIAKSKEAERAARTAGQQTHVRGQIAGLRKALLMVQQVRKAVQP